MAQTPKKATGQAPDAPASPAPRADSESAAKALGDAADALGAILSAHGNASRITAVSALDELLEEGRAPRGANSARRAGTTASALRGALIRTERALR